MKHNSVLITLDQNPLHFNQGNKNEGEYEVDNDPELCLILKDTHSNKEEIGSVKILRSTILQTKLNTPYKLWFTLF